MSASFHMGNQTTSYVHVEVLERAYPRAIDDYWDGNWLTSVVEVSAGPWGGRIEPLLRADDFSRFRSQLQRLYDDVDAPSAVFDSMEPSLKFTVERSDRLGHIRITGQARAEPFELHNVLPFVIDIDQSYLPATLAELAEITKQFPVVAAPRG